MSDLNISGEAIATLRAALLRRGYGEDVVTELLDEEVVVEATRLLSRPDQIGSTTLEEFDALGQWVMAFHEMCAEVVTAAFMDASERASAAVNEWLDPR